MSTYTSRLELEEIEITKTEKLLALVLTVFFLIIHGWWLPRNGINGWTGEPKARYYELRGWPLAPPE